MRPAASTPVSAAASAARVREGTSDMEDLPGELTCGLGIDLTNEHSVPSVTGRRQASAVPAPVEGA